MKSLLGHEFKAGKAIECDPAIAWKLEGQSPLDLLLLTRRYEEAEEDESARDEIDDNSLDGDEAEDSDEASPIQVLFDDGNDSEIEAEEEEDTLSEVAICEDGMKLLPFME